MRYKDHTPLAEGWGDSKAELEIMEGLWAPSYRYPRSQPSYVGTSYHATAL